TRNRVGFEFVGRSLTVAARQYCLVPAAATAAAVAAPATTAAATATVATTAARARTLFAGLGFVNGQRPALELLAVHRGDRGLSPVVHLNECKPAAPP